MRLAALVGVVVAAAIATASIGGSPRGAGELVQTFAQDWSERDWAALYAMVDRGTRASMPYASFAAGYEAAWETATVSNASVLARSIRATGGSESIELRIHTRIFGTLTETYTLPLSGKGDAQRVLWYANLEFPGLYPGEALRRVTIAPRRGRLLARDGVPLASLASASNIFGTLGTASGTQLRQLEAAGFPATTPIGTSGLEYVFQAELAGRPGGKLYAGSRLLARTRARRGEDVRTSIDPELQNEAVAALGSKAGGIVLMAPHSGELLAVAGTPLSELQPPGSTFKIVTTTAVLEAGLATVNSTYPYATYATIEGYKLHNSDSEDCGGTLINAFAVSCNSVYAPLGVRLGASRLVAAARVYGFNSPSPIPIAAESTLPAPAGIPDDIALGSSAIGQYQDLASPLQMVRIADTIALGGLEPIPTFATAVHPKLRRIVPAGVAHTIRRMMIAVTRYGDGTGVQAQLPGVTVAAKTGTAQLTPPSCSPSTGTTGTSAASGSGASSPAGATSPPAGSTGTTQPPGTPGGTSPTGGGVGIGGGASAPSAAVSPAAGIARVVPAAHAAQAGDATNGTTGPCGTSRNNPYNTDAWFVAFAPAYAPRVAVAVELDHDGAGGASAAPLARELIADALRQGF
jgi:peptidoglycan glycosyltransferase